MTASDHPRDDGPADAREADTDDQYSTPNYDGQRTLDKPNAGIGDLKRRDYLRAVGAAGAAGAAGLGGPGAGTAGAQSGWEAEADQRIQEHRTGDLEVEVVDGAGNPVSDAQVEVQQQEHDYVFGCMVHAEFLTNGTEWGEPFTDDQGNEYGEEDRQQYEETLDELFNGVVLENYHKWGIWEDISDVENSPGGDAPDDAVDWAVEHEMHVRGHVCLWGNVDAWAVPPDVVKAMDVQWGDHDIYQQDADVTPDPSVWPDDEDPENPQPTPNHDPQHVIDRSMDHIERIIDHYGDAIDEWEIVNEVFHEPEMIRAVDGNGPNDGNVDPTTATILGDWYEHAEEVAAQYDIDIAVNDYSTLAGPYGSEREDYRSQIQYLVEDRGIDLDGVGFQCHFGESETLSPDQIVSGIDEYAQAAGDGVGFRATEFDTYQGGWGDQQKAEFTRQFLKTWFSHPRTEAFLAWGHWDPVHWEGDSPFFRSDWTEKPALGEYRDLVFGEWWTEESGTTDSSGIFSTSAFLGEHQVTVDVGGETVEQTVSVTDPDGTERVTVAVGGGACEDVPTETVDGQTVCDVDDDPLFEDVTGDGTLGQDDVVTFFENQHRDAWQQPDLFDFSDNGSVGHGDVVALFEEVVV